MLQGIYYLKLKTWFSVHSILSFCVNCLLPVPFVEKPPKILSFRIDVITFKLFCAYPPPVYLNFQFVAKFPCSIKIVLIFLTSLVQLIGNGVGVSLFVNGPIGGQCKVYAGCLQQIFLLCLSHHDCSYTHFPSDKRANSKQLTMHCKVIYKKYMLFSTVTDKILSPVSRKRLIHRCQ